MREGGGVLFVGVTVWSDSRHSSQLMSNYFLGRIFSFTQPNALKKRTTFKTIHHSVGSRQWQTSFVFRKRLQWTAPIPVAATRLEAILLLRPSLRPPCSASSADFTREVACMGSLNLKLLVPVVQHEVFIGIHPAGCRRGLRMRRRDHLRRSHPVLVLHSKVASDPPRWMAYGWGTQM